MFRLPYNLILVYRRSQHLIPIRFTTPLPNRNATYLSTHTWAPCHQDITTLVRGAIPTS